VDWQLFFVVLTVFVALIFDFINGFHDAANSVATIVSTRVLKPHFAVIWAAFFNFIAFLVFETSVANTIGKGVIDSSLVDTAVIFSALNGAITWNIITWYLGIPSSSSHALVGGLVGASLAKSGSASLVWSGIIKIVVSIFISPLIGFLLGFLLMLLVMNLFFRVPANNANKTFRILQLFSAALYSLGHGGNDAQKTMGVITVLLFANGYLGGEFYVPFWVVFFCHLAIGLGTLCGGWRIVKTLGMKLTKLKPVGGFCAETGGAITLFCATGLGIPVSTTHTITGSILGVGTVEKVSGVRWNLVSNIFVAWVLTIPFSALIAGTTLCLISFL
jgi:inorganic phosphate transporter, PiT family